MKVYISGSGVVSAIGSGAEENFASLQSGVSGIKKSSVYNLMMAEVKLSNKEIQDLFALPQREYSRTSLLSLIAAKEAWGSNRHYNQVKTGMISSTSLGGLDKTQEYYFQSRNEQSNAYKKLMTFDNGRATETVASFLGISGYIGTISTACSSGANAIMQGARLIESGKLDRVLVGGADPIALFNIKGFSALNIYDSETCKPFDENRKGLNLGEGAGFLMLENEKSLSVTGNKPLCVLSGWDNATDAYHQTASSPTGKGATQAMVNALTKAEVKPEQINYINAHGTGTGNNDLSESIAIKNVFGEKVPCFSSTKSFTGHTLAAAGAIEAVYSVMAIISDSIFPSLHFTTPMKETSMIPNTHYLTNQGVTHVLSNSFGFGGNCSCLIFSKLVS
jgi:3-oxoacyl-(acyl-carrier-protein) synthase